MTGRRGHRVAKLGTHAGNPRRHSTVAYTAARKSTVLAHSTTTRVARAKRRRH